MTVHFSRIDLIAGPPAANPPVLLAGLVVLISLSGPYLFLMAGRPNLLLGIAAAALAMSGIVTAMAAATAQKRFHADKKPRLRACLTSEGVIFHPTQAASSNLTFSLDHISAIKLLPRALVVVANKHHPKPGRHRLVFGPPYITPHETLNHAIEALNSQVNKTLCTNN